MQSRSTSDTMLIVTCRSEYCRNRLGSCGSNVCTLFVISGGPRRQSLQCSFVVKCTNTWKSAHPPMCSSPVAWNSHTTERYGNLPPMMQVKSVQLTYIWIHYTWWCTLQGQGTYLVMQLTSHSILPVSFILLLARVTGATCSFICVVKPNILKVKIDIMGNFWHEDLCMSARNVSLPLQRVFVFSVSFSSVGYDAICIKFESVPHTMFY